MKNLIVYFFMEENFVIERLFDLFIYNMVYSIFLFCWIVDEVVIGKMLIYWYINISILRLLKILYVYYIWIFMIWYLIMWFLFEKFWRILYILFREVFGRSLFFKDFKLIVIVFFFVNIKLFFENYCF